jgi:hypothetical protein
LLEKDNILIKQLEEFRKAPMNTIKSSQRTTTAVLGRIGEASGALFQI